MHGLLLAAGASDALRLGSRVLLGDGAALARQQRRMSLVATPVGDQSLTKKGRKKEHRQGKDEILLLSLSRVAVARAALQLAVCRVVSYRMVKSMIAICAMEKKHQMDACSMRLGEMSPAR